MAGLVDCGVGDGLAGRVEGDAAGAVYAPLVVGQVVDHSGFFVDAYEGCLGQQVTQLLGPALPEVVVVGQYTGVGDKPEALDDLLAAGIIEMFTENHGTGAAAGDDRARGQGCAHGLPGWRVAKALAEMAGEAAQQIDQFRPCYHIDNGIVCG